MVKKVAATLVVLWISISSSVAPAQSARSYVWKLDDSEQGCQNFTSNVAGKDYVAAKTVCIVPARMDVVGTVLRDIASFPKWMEDCKDTRMLRVVDEKNDVFLFWLRQHITLFADRDVVLKTETELRPGRAFIKAYSSRESAYDAGEGYVRMPSFSSEFTLEWVDREHTRVTFMIDPDLGDGLPRGIANSVIRKTPLKSLQGMSRMVRDPKYIQAARGSAYERAVLEGMRNGTLK